MILNNVINHLKLWCREKAETYRKAYGARGGASFVGYQAADELEFKLSMLMDKPFETPEAFKCEVLSLLDVHYAPSVLKPQNNVAKHIVEKLDQEFRAFLDTVLSTKEEFPVAEIPYSRVIVGPEAAALQEKFRRVWGYVNTSCWYPLAGEEPREIEGKFFILFDYLEPYLNQLEAMIGLPQSRMYSFGEGIYRFPYCLETVELIEYGGLETIYTDRDFSWAIYFSHEKTVAFAGTIVPKVKQLLSGEKIHWNRFEWSWLEETAGE